MKQTDYKIRQKFKKLLGWFNRHIPPGIRTLTGLFLVIAGFFGFLPVLGFWMIPLGLAVIMLDYRWVRRKLAERGK
ncbi:hypothetical protein [Profundibacter amoris]|uniref:Uncharacterized protein n=1 Tax=Profundibacter amoris TaxID=2171755 RepID=A0A347UJX4_9RHOB|nr:hypothetical protein [Profundibacter amoris]AXX99152.1 hypothetical protein BAR1_15140 [Profundibacter amoris]